MRISDWSSDVCSSDLLRSDPGFSPRSDPPVGYVSDVIGGSRWVFLLCEFGLLSRAVLEAEAVVSGLQDVAVVGEPIEECGGHLRVTEHAGPLTEAEVGGDDDAGALVEFAQQMERSEEHTSELQSLMRISYAVFCLKKKKKKKITN